MMENVTESNAGQESGSAGTTAASLGSRLREARERLGLTVMDVSSQIKFAPKQIEALEADDFRHLPETAFVRGFVRSYAKVLQLDAETLLAALPQKKAAAPELAPEPVKELSSDLHSALRQNKTWLGGALALIVIVAGFALWQSGAPPERAKVARVESPVALPAETPVSSVQPVPETAPAEAEPPKAPPPKMEAPKTLAPKAQPPKARRDAALAQSAVPAASGVPAKKPAVAPAAETGAPLPVAALRLQFDQDAWAEIKDRDGKILSSRTHLAGSELRVNGRPPLSVLIGNAPTVRVYFRDKPVDLTRHTRRSTGVASLTLE